jgi:hypothetical protein
MALGALIGAYQEDDEGGLRALLPLAGQSLIEYQVRCAAAADASPIVVVVERLPVALNEAFDRLRLDGIPVVAVSDPRDAARRFEPGGMVLLVGDGVVPTPELIARVADEEEQAIATLSDDADHEQFERIDAQARWAGLAVVDGHLLASTVSILGDWDLQSTLLRRAIQDGALRIPLGEETGEPLLVDSPDQLQGFEQAMVKASRAAGQDFTSRFILAPAEDLATRRLMETMVRPVWLLWTALGLTAGAAVAFLCGWPRAAVALLVLSAPLDLIAARLSVLRLRPLPVTLLTRRLLWPAAAVALVALGWWTMRAGWGWGAFATALTAAAFAEAARIEAPKLPLPGEMWLFSRRNAILLAVPFAILGAWGIYLGLLASYAACSFFLLQNVRHRDRPS